MQYRDELEKLRQRSVKGTEGSVRCIKGIPKVFPGKLALTPEKLNAIRSQYNQRIQKHAVESTDFSIRVADSHFNKILNGILSNYMRKTVHQNAI